MELSKHNSHRNPKYLTWLRKQKCVASGNKAQCAHHIRLGTNGGSSLKPSDYFCIPLLNEYHTTGLFAIHVVGEDTFLKHFGLNRNQLFIKFLKQYLVEEFEIHIQLEEKSEEKLIAYMIKLIEEKGPTFETGKRKKKKVNPKNQLPKVSITESEYYQKTKELKRESDKQLRLKLKEESSLKTKTVKSVKKTKKKSVTESEFYQKAKELKRVQQKELRDRLKAQKKENSALNKKSTLYNSEFYEKAKEFKRARDKELRAKLKLEKQNSI